MKEKDTKMKEIENEYKKKAKKAIQSSSLPFFAKKS